MVLRRCHILSISRVCCIIYNYMIIIVWYDICMLMDMNEEKIGEEIYFFLYLICVTCVCAACVVSHSRTCEICTYIDSFERKSGKRLYAIIIKYIKHEDNSLPRHTNTENTVVDAYTHCWYMVHTHAICNFPNIYV